MTVHDVEELVRHHHDLEELDRRIASHFTAQITAFEAKLMRAVVGAVVAMLGLCIAGLTAFVITTQRVNEHNRRISDIESMGSAPVRVAVASMQSTLNANALTLAQLQQDIAELSRRVR